MTVREISSKFPRNFAEISDELEEAKQEEKELRDAIEQDELAGSGDEENYDHLMEEYLDEMYEEYVTHSLNRTQRIK